MRAREPGGISGEARTSEGPRFLESHRKWVVEDWETAQAQRFLVSGCVREDGREGLHLQQVRDGRSAAGSGAASRHRRVFRGRGGLRGRLAPQTGLSRRCSRSSCSQRPLPSFIPATVLPGVRACAPSLGVCCRRCLGHCKHSRALSDPNSLPSRAEEPRIREGGTDQTSPTLN